MNVHFRRVCALRWSVRVYVLRWPCSSERRQCLLNGPDVWRSLLRCAEASRLEQMAPAASAPPRSLLCMCSRLRVGKCVHRLRDSIRVDVLFISATNRITVKKKKRKVRCFFFLCVSDLHFLPVYRSLIGVLFVFWLVASVHAV